jgi:N4-gp56 family major capsid protein
MNKYNDPNDTPSTIDGANGKQINTYFWHRKALIDAAKEAYFTPLADVMSMPKHYGKTIKVLHYVPLLDERNINDQGIDAAGAVLTGAAGANPGYGNLYGSSKDIGTITGKLPTLTENGGRVNRVGFTRISREGSITQFGFFTEFTEESLDFDSDEELYSHLSRELVTGATQLTEAVLQKDLLAGAGIVVYTGDATSDVTMSAESSDIAEVTYEDLMRMSRVLNDNRTPKQTKVISGSRMIDTKVISAGRVLYIGSELEFTVKGMTDLFGDPAFIPVSKYASGGAVLNGEIGTVDAFRIIMVPEMLHWAEAGAAVTTNPGYVQTGDNYDIFPMLVIGDASFTTIGFQTGGKMMKFKIITKMPGEKTADRTDPFGLMGFSSIRWWYGTLLLRPERIALLKSLAKI